jgi:hypothetical protein
MFRRKPHKIIFRSKETGKKLFVCRYTDEEFSQIEAAALSVKMTVAELIENSLKNLK